MSHPSRPSHASRRPASRKRTADVRTALVDAAWWVLEHEGLANLTVRAVATRAGVAPMGVYNHLRDKDGLLAALLTRAFDLFADALAHPAGLPAADALLAQGRAYREFALAHPAAYAVMFGPDRTAVAGSRTEDADHAAVDEAGRRAFEQLLDGVRAGQAAGVVRADPPELIAFTLWSAVHGALTLETATRLPPEVTDAGYEAVLRTFLRGIAPD